MYKILLCDDEGIVREGLKFLIHKEFGENCLIEEAKSGRIAIEKSATFRPDVIFMDIQMSGINGIEAMREIRKVDKHVILIVLTAYDRFTYAKDSIDVGVLEYLTKPFNKVTVLSILTKAMAQIDDYRRKVSQEMEIKEKLEMVIPIIESGFVSSIFLQDFDPDDLNQYQSLLDMEQESGYMILVKYGDQNENGTISNPVGAGVKAMKNSEGMTEILKEFFPTSFSTILGNRAVLFVPYPNVMSYEERVLCVERAYGMVRKLEQKHDMRFRAGIGEVMDLANLAESYKESARACKHGLGKVNHIQDIKIEELCPMEYPLEIEGKIFESLKAGDSHELNLQIEHFMTWLKAQGHRPDYTHRLKVLELVLQGESCGQNQGGSVYSLTDRSGYLEFITECDSFDLLEDWLREKLTEVANKIPSTTQMAGGGVVTQAIDYLADNFTKDISLDDISRLVNISPYYFSKIFKEAHGINFVEY